MTKHECFHVTACYPSNYGLPEHCFPPCSAARGLPTNDSDFTQSANSCFALRQRRLPFGPFFLVEWVPIPCSKSQLGKSSSGSGNHGGEHLANRPLTHNI
jgi:hypothetical protein